MSRFLFLPTPKKMRLECDLVSQFVASTCGVLVLAENDSAAATAAAADAAATDHRNKYDVTLVQSWILVGAVVLMHGLHIFSALVPPQWEALSDELGENGTGTGGRILSSTVRLARGRAVTSLTFLAVLIGSLLPVCCCCTPTNAVWLTVSLGTMYHVALYLPLVWTVKAVWTSTRADNGIKVNVTPYHPSDCDEDDGGRCVICQNPLLLHATAAAATETQPPPLLRTLCGHVFHAQCLRAWTSYASSCPLCRNSPVVC